MTFQDAEKTYKDLKTQHAAGKLSDADFEAKVGELRMQDAQGRWWQLGVQTGEWYMHDGQKWNKAKPPMTPVATATSPGAAPEGGAKSKRSSVLPARLFSAAPAGRGGGLPPAALIVIIAVVALVGLAILIGGYLFISSSRGGTSARASSTPTLSIAALASPVIPTITLAAPTDTPLPPPTIAVTTTEVVTPTRAAAKPTATKKPVTPTPTGPTATPKPNLPAGVFVQKMRLDPSKPTFNTPITFHVTFINTSSGAGPTPWLMKLYKCVAACTASELQTSVGETPKSSAQINGGTTELAVGPWQVGLGVCNYVASPFYVDSLGNVVPFQTADGGARLYYNFSLCQ